MAEEVKFCPFLTVVRAGQATYLTCQTTCIFYLGNECAFITIARALKETAKPKIIELSRKDKTDES